MIYKNKKTKNISFPLGGIGTGCIGLYGNGELGEWEIQNRPNKTKRNGYSHFAIKAKMKDRSTVKVLQGDALDNFMGRFSYTDYGGMGNGLDNSTLAGFPHFKNTSFEGDFPFARIKFSDPDFPATVKLCAFNPFIPHDEYNSSLPAAFFEWTVKNTSDEDIEFAIACTVQNRTVGGKNKKLTASDFNGLMLNSENLNGDDVNYTDLCILTDGKEVAVQEYWYRGKWQDKITVFWKNLSELDRLPSRVYEAEGRKKDHGTVVSYVSIAPKKSARLRFVISWNAPNAYNYWSTSPDYKDKTWKNYYATEFESSLESGEYALKHFSSLFRRSKQFCDAMKACTLPSYVMDAISSNLSVLKTPTTMRLTDGSFWGWEGCQQTVGSCFGSCQHVWNYAYALPYLFPRLERSMRENTFKYALLENGASTFRIDLPPRRITEQNFRPCVDGQMEEVIRCYRQWRFTGDDSWLKDNSKYIFSMLEYAWSDKNPDKWDENQDGVLEGRQHHTLDMELFGPSSWLQGFYLLALECGAKMAKYLGDENRAKLYTKIFNSGKEWCNENLFNGEYFCQKVEIANKEILEKFNAVEPYWNSEAKQIKYQIADGCMIDQMLSDWHAALIGEEGVFDKDKKRTALKSLYKYNFKSSMREVTNMWRNFALNDEGGTLICSYPDSVKTPAIPIPYCEETMTGFEYALAGLMIHEGFITEGESMVKAIRDRYDGEKRNPFNEIECGNNYARSMASYALMPIYSGFKFDMTKKHIGFAPKAKNGKYLFSVCQSWGTVSFDERSFSLSVMGEPLTLASIFVPLKEIKEVTSDNEKIDFEFSKGTVCFKKLSIKKELKLS